MSKQVRQIVEMEVIRITKADNLVLQKEIKMFTKHFTPSLVFYCLNQSVGFMVMKSKYDGSMVT